MFINPYENMCTCRNILRDSAGSQDAGETSAPADSQTLDIFARKNSGISQNEVKGKDCYCKTKVHTEERSAGMLMRTSHTPQSLGFSFYGCFFN